MGLLVGVECVNLQHGPTLNLIDCLGAHCRHLPQAFDHHLWVWQGWLLLRCKEDQEAARVLVWRLRCVPIQFFNSPHSRPRLARAVLLRENEEESQLRMQENGHQKFCVPHPHAAAERNIHSQTHRQSVEYTIDYRFSLFRIYPYFRSECPEGARSIFYLFCQWFCLSHRSCIVAMGCCCGKKKPPAKTPAEPPQAPPEPEVAASVHTGS